MERFVDSEERSVLDLPIWMLLVLASDMQSSSATEDAKILIRGSVNMRMINESQVQSRISDDMRLCNESLNLENLPKNGIKLEVFIPNT